MIVKLVKYSLATKVAIATLPWIDSLDFSGSDHTLKSFHDSDPEITVPTLEKN